MMIRKITIPTDPSPAPAGQFLIYRDGANELRVRLDGETIWLTQKQIAELYQVSPKTVSEHLRNVVAEEELQPERTIRKFRMVRSETQRQVARTLDHYSLDMVLAVGYRVRSHRGTAFRQWATAQLGDLLTKGFVLDDQRLKDGHTIGQSYFDELLERIRDIRASERMFYDKIKDVFATSIDYDPSDRTSQQFFATVQNKLHWAAHGHTAAEVLFERVDASKPNLGLTGWKNAPAGPIRKTDINVGKNVLTHEEISELNRIVTMYLDFAEDQARRKLTMHMRDWITKLDSFLQFNERNVLDHAGKISREMMETHVTAEFAKWDERRRVRNEAMPALENEVKQIQAIMKKTNKLKS
jgi:hypothetical protein